MLAKRIIPTLLCRGRTLIKGVAFDAWRSVGVAAQAVRVHQARGVDELVLLDIAATKEHRSPDLGLIEELSEVCFMPLTIGGGVRSVADVKDLLTAGADKVVVGTAAHRDPYLINKIADKVGSQVLVVAVDVKYGDVWIECGTEHTRTDPRRYADLVAAAGAGEILLTSIEREGTLTGYDLELISTVARSVSIPVIAAGGAGTYQHMLEAIEAGADAVAAGAMFLFCDATPAGAARYLMERGIETRVPIFSG
jgi:cyclase